MLVCVCDLGLCEKCGEGHGEVRCRGSVCCTLEVFLGESMEPLRRGNGGSGRVLSSQAWQLGPSESVCRHPSPV